MLSVFSDPHRVASVTQVGNSSELPTAAVSYVKSYDSIYGSNHVSIGSLSGTTPQLGTSHQVSYTQLMKGWNTQSHQTHTQFHDHHISTKEEHRKKISSIARRQNSDKQVGGKTVAASPGIRETFIPEKRVSAQTINQFPMLSVTKNMAKVTEVILSAVITTKKVPTLQSLKVPISKITAGKHKMMFKSSTVLDHTTGKGQVNFLLCTCRCILLSD